jgi:C-terminal processing protease CtpA/Prc
MFSEASFELIIKGIHTTDGLCLVVYPEKKPFPGKIYVLTNGNTGSTCEPLVYGLKHSKRATIVGEKTYGGMLNGEQFNITKNFRLWVPTADYYTSDGKKIDRIGVAPDVVCKSDEALEKTLVLISKNL